MTVYDGGLQWITVDNGRLHKITVNDSKWQGRTVDNGRLIEDHWYTGVIYFY